MALTIDTVNASRYFPRSRQALPIDRLGVFMHVTCTFTVFEPGSIPGSSTIVPRLTSRNTTKYPPGMLVKTLVKSWVG